MISGNMDEVKMRDLRFSLHAVSRVLPEEPDDSALSWKASLSSVAVEEEPVELATAELWTIHRSGDFSMHVVLDAISSDLAKYAVLLDGEEFQEGLDLGGFGDGMVIVDRVAVPPRMRGRGFGPLLLAESLSVLSRGLDVIACEPAPYELRPDQPEWLLEKDRLERLWGKFGFVQWRDGIWFVDPARTTLDQTREILRARFS